MHLQITYLHIFLYSKVISIQSEASILQKASEEIGRLVENKSQSNDNGTEKLIESNSANVNQQPGSSILKDRLQNQVRTGEITPFQAVNKEAKTNQSAG